MPGSSYGNNFRAPKVDVHDFSMIPRASIPRSHLRMQSQHKTTIGASWLIPVYLQEVLPGDSFNVSMTAFCRLAVPLFPMMDNMDLESFFFFVPNRLVWSHWQLFCGEQLNPGDSVSYTIPQVVSPVNGFVTTSIYDYMGLPCAGQTAVGNTISVSALPFRAYNLIFNQWFRDENLQPSQGFGASNTPTDFGDGPDPNTNYGLVFANRRHDYFTACLPWTQKSPAGTPISIPLTGNATVRTNASALITSGSVPTMTFGDSAAMGTLPANNTMAGFTPAGNLANFSSPAGVTAVFGVAPTNLYADMSTVTASTINALRLAFQTQKLLERDARGGTRYTEIVRSHFGVVSPDARLQRPEYLGGGKSPVNMVPVPQTAATGASGTTTPIGTLSGVGTAVARHGFRQSFTEHGHVLGLVTVRSTQSYQQGIRRLWSRSTRYDFYWPVFAALGEQAVLNKEIYSDGSANDNLVFGYQERWAEYRYNPSRTTSYFNSKNATPLDAWHLGIKYAALPVLNSSFIPDQTGATLNRNLALGASSANQQFLCDFFFDEKAARPMPMYSVPGLIDHF